MWRSASFLIVGASLAGCLGAASDPEPRLVGPPPTPTFSRPPPRVRLDASNVSAFLTFADRSGDLDIDYVRGELDRIKGDTAVEDALEAALDGLWSVSSGRHQITDGPYAGLLLDMIKHLRLPRAEAYLGSRIDLIVDYSTDATFGVAIAQSRAGEALVCIPTESARQRVEELAQNHPSATVRSAIERQLQYQYCKYAQSAKHP